MTNPNNSAFPADAHTQSEGGLTKRENFAAMVFQGMYSNNGLVDQWDCEDILALNAAKAADALIEALNKTPNHESI